MLYLTSSGKLSPIHCLGPAGAPEGGFLYSEEDDGLLGEAVAAAPCDLSVLEEYRVEFEDSPESAGPFPLVEALRLSDSINNASF